MTTPTPATSWTATEALDFLDDAPVAVHALDGDARILWCNRAQLELLGYSSHECVGRSAADFYANPQEADEILQRLRAGELLRNYAVVLRTKAGSMRQCLLSANARLEGGAMRYGRVFTRDITASAAVHEALAASEERFRLLVEGVKDYAIYMLDSRGRVESWNSGAERTKGYSAAEIIGQDYVRFFTPEDVAAGKPQRELKTAAEAGRFEEEAWRVRKDGSRFFAHVVLTALRGPAGELRGYAKVIRDVTDQRQTQEAREQLLVAERDLRNELERRVAERTAELRDANTELEDFAYSVAHDLRAPLRGMQGFAKALLEDYGAQLDETGRDYARRVVAAAARLDRLIQDLLAYSRLSRDDLHLEPVDLDKVVRDVIAGMDEELRARRARVELRSPLPSVTAHRATLDQVIWNLLDNAVKFVAPGVQPCVLIWPERRDNRVRLWVQDNGIGIAQQHHARIFHVFERLHGTEAYPGTGIGLAVVRKAMERMGGVAGVESELGRGSRFWIELPEGRSH